MLAKPYSAAFPREFHSQVKAALSELKLSSSYEYGYFTVNVLGETLFIPNRVTTPPIKPNLSGLSVEQRRVAQCILTRSMDGFERQAALREILLINEPWSIPFIIALVGEYVIEIIDDIYRAAPHFERAVVATFIRENPAYYKLTRDRVMSYWNCNYRSQFWRGDDYVGFRLLRELDAMMHAELR